MITLVTGFGRCGSSLVMQMLEAGGMAVTGIWPAFEDPLGLAIVCGEPIDAQTMARFEGKVLKVLDPHRARLPRGFEYRAIWCYRNPAEQARSQMKLLAMMGLPHGRELCRRFERSYSKDRVTAIDTLRRAGVRDMLVVAFEDVLAKPALLAAMIAGFCELDDAAPLAMARAVRPREPQCAPGVDMELALIAERRPPYVTTEGVSP